MIIAIAISNYMDVIPPPAVWFLKFKAGLRAHECLSTNHSPSRISSKNRYSDILNGLCSSTVAGAASGFD